jgi:hypothetical protein
MNPHERPVITEENKTAVLAARRETTFAMCFSEVSPWRLLPGSSWSISSGREDLSRRRPAER